MKRAAVLTLCAALLTVSAAQSAEPIEWSCSPTVCTAARVGSSDINCRGYGTGYMTCSPWVDFVANGRSAVATGGISLPGRIRMTAAIVDCEWRHGQQSGRCLDGPERTSGIGRWEGLDGTTSTEVKRRLRIPAFRVPTPGFSCTSVSVFYELKSTASTVAYQVPVDSVTVGIVGGRGTTICI